MERITKFENRHFARISMNIRLFFANDSATNRYEYSFLANVLFFQTDIVTTCYASFQTWLVCTA